MPTAFIFDVFGTIVDWRSGVAAVVQQTFEEKNISFDPYEFADLWRGQYQPAMQRIRTGNRGYVPLDKLHLENLEVVLKETGLETGFDVEEKHILNKAWQQLPPWKDSVPGLLELKKRSIIAPCSNGSIALMTRLSKYGGLPWDCILGADIARNYKPHRDVYQACADALALPPEEIVMVAAHNDDLAAARKHRLKTEFIPRICEHGSAQTTDLVATQKWDYTIDSIRELVSYA